MVMTEHARERTEERIPRRDLRLFVRGVEKAARQGGFFGMWAIKVVCDKRVLGYAVGAGRTWETTLTPGMAPHDGYDFRTVQA